MASRGLSQLEFVKYTVLDVGYSHILCITSSTMNQTLLIHKIFFPNSNNIEEGDLMGIRYRIEGQGIKSEVFIDIKCWNSDTVKFSLSYGSDGKAFLEIPTNVRHLDVTKCDFWPSIRNLPVDLDCIVIDIFSPVPAWLNFFNCSVNKRVYYVYSPQSHHDDNLTYKFTRHLVGDNFSYEERKPAQEIALLRKLSSLQSTFMDIELPSKDAWCIVNCSIKTEAFRQFTIKNNSNANIPLPTTRILQTQDMFLYKQPVVKRGFREYIPPKSSINLELSVTPLELGECYGFVILDFGQDRMLGRKFRVCCTEDVGFKGDIKIFHEEPHQRLPTDVSKEKWSTAYEKFIKRRRDTSQFHKIDEDHDRQIKLGRFPIPDVLLSAVESGNDVNLLNQLTNVRPLNFNWLSFQPTFQTCMWIEEAIQRIQRNFYDVENPQWYIYTFVENESGQMLEDYTDHATIVKSAFLEMPSKLLCRVIIPNFYSIAPPVTVFEEVIFQFEGCEDRFQGIVRKIHAGTRHDGSASISIHVCKSSWFWLKERTPMRLLQFALNRIPFRRVHRSLRDLLKKQFLEQKLFPVRAVLSRPTVSVLDASITAIGTVHGETSPIAIQWIPGFHLNNEQKTIVLAVVRGRCQDIPYIIWGPYGCGKTYTLVACLAHIYKYQPNCRILVTAHSNAATDVIMKKLCEYYLLFNDSVVRLYSDLAFESLSAYDKKKSYNMAGSSYNPSSEDCQQKRIIVTTLCNSFHLRNICLQKEFNFEFSHIVVDEAGFVSEADTSIVFGLASKETEIILAGDPKQLPPYCTSGGDVGNCLQKSAMERLLENRNYYINFETGMLNPLFAVQLLHCYRCHPQLMDLASNLFYQGHLKSACPKEVITQTNAIPFLHGLPYLFHSVIGHSKCTSESTSYFNVEEAIQVKNYVEKLLASNVSISDIGVISPYTKQVEVISRCILDSKICDDGDLPLISTVESFQGGERDFILFSTVRSLTVAEAKDQRSSFEFIFQSQRLNVAITRARCGLIVIGNPHVLSINRNWQKIISIFLEEDAVTGADFPPNLDPRWKNELKITEAE